MDKLFNVIDTIKNNIGISMSMFIHIILFSFLLVNLPQCKRKVPQENIISIDLLPISKVSNVKNQDSSKPKPKLKKEEKPIEKESPVKKEKPKEPIKTEIKEKPKEATKPIIKKKTEPKKKEEKPIVKTKPIKKKKIEKKAKSEEVDVILKDLLAEVEKNDKNKEIAKTKTKGTHNADMPLSLSLKDSIKKQIEQCWNPPAGNMDAGKLEVLLSISFNKDGSVSNVKIKDSFKYNGDELYRVAADAAIRAVYKCSPLEGLPVGQYSSWRDIEFNFDPSNLIY